MEKMKSIEIYLKDSSILHKKIEVKKYPLLETKITDDLIEIVEIFSELEHDNIVKNFKPYLEDYSVLPIAGTLGDNVICVSQNSEDIYYYDFDFGFFHLNQSIQEFIDWLID